MALKETLDKVPYWKAVAIAMLGATVILWLNSVVLAAIAVDNGRDDATYARKETVQDNRERLVRIETTLDTIKTILEKTLNK